MRILVTGAGGVLGRATVPLLRGAGHEVAAPDRRELDLFDPVAIAAAVGESEAVLHLATRIPPREEMDRPGAWHENDRLRRDASRHLVDAALAASTQAYVFPSVTFLYPRRVEADEATPVGPVPAMLRSALAGEAEAARFAAAGRAGVVLRLGLLDGPGTANPAPNATAGATLHAADAGRALAASLALPGGTYNVCRDGERVSNARFRQATGWRPER